MDTSDTDAIWTADQAFYMALSGRDMDAMKTVWARRPYVICIGPRSKNINVGFEAVQSYWEWAFDFFAGITSSKTDARIRSDGTIAWIVGIEHATLRLKTGGEPDTFDAFSTHVFEKIEGQWMLVSHHAQKVPA